MAIRTIDAQFQLSAHKELPPEAEPEVAFVGRSNVGKSSLLNALAERKALARASKDPGRTQALNFFLLRLRDEDSREERHLRLVDLPGYGHAKVSKKVRADWQEEIGGYIQERNALRAILLLMDIRREPEEEELFFLQTKLGNPVTPVLTKADQVGKNEQRDAVARIERQFRRKPFLVSSSKGIGVLELRAHLYELGLE